MNPPLAHIIPGLERWRIVTPQGKLLPFERSLVNCKITCTLHGWDYEIDDTPVVELEHIYPFNGSTNTR